MCVEPDPGFALQMLIGVLYSLQGKYEWTAAVGGSYSGSKNLTDTLKEAGRVYIRNGGGSRVNKKSTRLSYMYSCHDHEACTHLLKLVQDENLTTWTLYESGTHQEVIICCVTHTNSFLKLLSKWCAK